MADEELEYSDVELEGGVTLEAGKEYQITEKLAKGKLRFQIMDGQGLEPRKELDLKFEGHGESISGKTDAEGKFEHPEPVRFGEYQLTVGKGTRVVQALPDDADTPHTRLKIPEADLEEPIDAKGSPHKDEEEEAEPEQQDPEEVKSKLWVKLLDAGGCGPLKDCNWTCVFGEAGSKTGTADGQGTVTVEEVPLGHFHLEVQIEGKTYGPATVSTQIEPAAALEVRVPGAPAQEEEEADESLTEGVADDDVGYEEGQA